MELVSGAARGIGAETARTLAKAGARVVLTDLLEAEGAATAAAIVATGGEAVFRRHDVTSEDDWAAATAVAVDQFGSLARISHTRHGLRGPRLPWPADRAGTPRGSMRGIGQAA